MNRLQVVIAVVIGLMMLLFSNEKFSLSTLKGHLSNSEFTFILDGS